MYWTTAEEIPRQQELLIESQSPFESRTLSTWPTPALITTIAMSVTTLVKNDACARGMSKNALHTQQASFGRRIPAAYASGRSFIGKGAIKKNRSRPREN